MNSNLPPVTPSLVKDFAPTGVLRAAINLGNAVLAGRAAGADKPHGISVDMAQALADRLQVTLQLHVINNAAESVRLVSEGIADIGFFAIDPARAQTIAFTAAYVLIEGAYMVREASTLKANEEVDVAAHRIMVAQGSAYDLYLTRNIKNATLLRTTTSQNVVPQMLAQSADVAAGVKQQLQLDAARLGGLRLLPGRFMVIEQAMGVSTSRSASAQSYLKAFVEEQKRSGFVAQAFKRHGIEGASVAPPV